MDSTVASVKGVDIATYTPEGAAYVRKITHPPSALDPLFKGRPDCSQPNVVLMELKGETNFSPAVSYATSATAITTAFPTSMLFLQTSGAFSACYAFYLVTFNGVASWIQALNQTAVAAAIPALNQVNFPALINQGYNATNFGTDISSYRSSYKSSTYYLNATGFNNQGMVTSAKFKPNVITSSILLALSDVANHKPSTENLLRALKSAGWKNSKLKEQIDGFENVNPTSSYASSNDYIQFLDFGRGPGGTSVQTTFNTGQFVSYFPTSASDLINLSPKAVSRPAKEGAFLVQQNVDPVALWCNSANSNPKESGLANTPSGGMTFCLTRYFNTTTNTWQYSTLFSGVLPPSGPQSLTSSVDTPWNNLDFTWTLFEGLTIPSGTSSTTGLPYITVKSFYGMELQVTEGSSLRSFQTQLPLPDSKAIEMACGIFHSRPDSLPSSANDWGTIGKIIMQALPVAAEWLTSAFKKNPTPKEKTVKEPIIKQKNQPKKNKQQIKNQSNPADVARIRQLTQQVQRLAVNRREPGFVAPNTYPRRKMQQPRSKRYQNQDMPLNQYMRKAKEIPI